MLGKIVNVFIESFGRLIISVMAITSANILLDKFAYIPILIVCILWVIKGYIDELQRNSEDKQ